MMSIEPPPTGYKASSGLFFPFLDGLRAVAILSVVLHHCFYFSPASVLGSAGIALLLAGRLGVAVFFVISGFLMGLIVFDATKPFDWSRYFLRRAGKILPPFLISLLLSAALWIYWKGAAGVAVTIMANLTTVANFIDAPATNMNPVYWSLFVEIHFYICLPLLYHALRRVTRYPDIWTCVLFFVIPVSIRAVLYWQGGPSYRQGFEGFGTAFPLRLDAFAPGLAFAAFYRRRSGITVETRWLRLAPWVGLAILAGTYLFYGATEYLEVFSRLHYKALFLELAYLGAGGATTLLLCLCAAPYSILGRALGSRHLGFIGLVSYEWYLFHFPPKAFMRGFNSSSHGHLGVYLLNTVFPTVISLALSALVYYCISAPILNRIKTRRIPIDAARPSCIHS